MVDIGTALSLLLLTAMPFGPESANDAFGASALTNPDLDHCLLASLQTRFLGDDIRTFAADPVCLAAAAEIVQELASMCGTQVAPPTLTVRFDFREGEVVVVGGAEDAAEVRQLLELMK